MLKTRLSCLLVVLAFVSACKKDEVVVADSGVDAGAGPRQLGGDKDAATDDTDDTEDAGKPSSDAGLAADGGGAAEPISIVSGLTDTFALAADDAFVYFYTGSELHRCPVTGCASGTGDKLVGPLAVPSSVATSGTQLFWTHHFNKIDTCTPGASAPSCTPSTFLDLGTTSSYPSHLRVRGGLLYWLMEDGATRRVQVCPVAGCSAGYPKTVLDSGDFGQLGGAAVSGISITDTHLFVLTYHGPLFRFELSSPEAADAGSGAQVATTIFSAGGSDVTDDGATLFWGIEKEGKLGTCALPECMPVSDGVSITGSPSAVSVAQAGLFIANRGTADGSGGFIAGTGSIILVPSGESPGGGSDAGAAASCGDLDPSPDAIDETQKNTAVPVPAGGDVHDGLYYLAHFDIYSPAVADAHTRNRLISIDGNKIAVVNQDDGGEVVRSSGTFVVSDKALEISVSCPGGAHDTSMPFTATPTEIRLFGDEPNVQIYVKQ